MSRVELNVAKVALVGTAFLIALVALDVVRVEREQRRSERRPDKVAEHLAEYEAACAQRWLAPCPTCLHGPCERRGQG